jgi:hypothetical protein
MPRDKCALSRLLGATDQLRRKKLSQRRIKFRLGIGFPLRREKEPGVVLLTRVTAEQIGTIVQQEMPFARFRQSRLAGLLKELRQIRRGRIFRRNRSREQKNDYQRKQDGHDGKQKGEQGSGR